MINFRVGNGTELHHIQCFPFSEDYPVWLYLHKSRGSKVKTPDESKDTELGDFGLYSVRREH